MKNTFQLEKVVEKLSHYLPSQSPLKDFIHHNTLHAFQHDSFHEGLKKSSKLFGYKTYLDLNEYRDFYAKGQIRREVLEKVLIEQKIELYKEKFENFKTHSVRKNELNMYMMSLDEIVNKALAKGFEFSSAEMAALELFGGFS